MDSQAANGGKNPEWDATDPESAKAHKWASTVKSKFLNGYKVNPEYISYLKSVNFSLEPTDLKDPARNQKNKDMHLKKWKNSLKGLESYVSTHHCLPYRTDSEHCHLRKWYFDQKYHLEKGKLTKDREEMLIATFGAKWTSQPSIHGVDLKSRNKNLEKWMNNFKGLESYVTTHNCLPNIKDSEHGHLRQWYKCQKYQLEKGTLTKWREEMMIATFGVKWTWDPSIHDVEIYGVRYYDFIHDDCRKVAQRFREKR